VYCIICWNENTRVIDSRVSEDGKAIRRRRECENCNNRFTTFEKIEMVNLIISKSWNRKERYDKNKLEDSILKSTNKRNISINIINNLISKLELGWMNKSEISSKEIWRDVMDMLLSLDEVAYIRYASVHLNFITSKDFMEFITKKIK
jgi:transcriptional repressor NrdR